MDAMFSCIFNFWDVRMRIAITWIVPKGYLLKKKSVSRGSFYQGEVGEGRANIWCFSCYYLMFHSVNMIKFQFLTLLKLFALNNVHNTSSSIIFVRSDFWKSSSNALGTVSRPKWIGSTRSVCVSLYTHTLRVLPIHFGRETVPSGQMWESEMANTYTMIIKCMTADTWT